MRAGWGADARAGGFRWQISISCFISPTFAQDRTQRRTKSDRASAERSLSFPGQSLPEHRSRLRSGGTLRVDSLIPFGSRAYCYDATVGAIKDHLFLWAAAVIGFWASSCTGGILMAFWWVASKKWPSAFRWLLVKRVAVAFFVFAFFQAWELQYTSNSGRNALLTQRTAEEAGALADALRMAHENATVTAEFHTCLNEGMKTTNANESVTAQAVGCVQQIAQNATPTPEEHRPTPPSKSRKSRPASASSGSPTPSWSTAVTVYWPGTPGWRQLAN